jgi:hypothetical protein
MKQSKEARATPLALEDRLQHIGQLLELAAGQVIQKMLPQPLQMNVRRLG